MQNQEKTDKDLAARAPTVRVVKRLYEGRQAYAVSVSALGRDGQSDPINEERIFRPYDANLRIDETPQTIHEKHELTRKTIKGVSSVAKRQLQDLKSELVPDIEGRVINTPNVLDVISLVRQEFLMSLLEKYGKALLMHTGDPDYVDAMASRLLADDVTSEDIQQMEQDIYRVLKLTQREKAKYTEQQSQLLETRLTEAVMAPEQSAQNYQQAVARNRQSQIPFNQRIAQQESYIQQLLATDQQQEATELHALELTNASYLFGIDRSWGRRTKEVNVLRIPHANLPFADRELLGYFADMLGINKQALPTISFGDKLRIVARPASNGHLNGHSENGNGHNEERAESSEGKEIFSKVLPRQASDGNGVTRKVSMQYVEETDYVTVTNSVIDANGGTTESSQIDFKAFANWLRESGYVGSFSEITNIINGLGGLGVNDAGLMKELQAQATEIRARRVPSARR